MAKRNMNISIESMMVILLMIVFVTSVCILLFEGSRTYRTIIDNKENEENARIALSYVNMRIKQNDVNGYIYIEDNEVIDTKVLVINHHGEEEGLKSYIYHLDGYLWECYTDELLDYDLSTAIIPIEYLDFKMADNEKQIITTIMYTYKDIYYPISQKTTLRAR